MSVSLRIPDQGLTFQLVLSGNVAGWSELTRYEWREFLLEIDHAVSQRSFSTPVSRMPQANTDLIASTQSPVSHATSDLVWWMVLCEFIFFMCTNLFQDSRSSQSVRFLEGHSLITLYQFRENGVDLPWQDWHWQRSEQCHETNACLCI